MQSLKVFKFKNGFNLSLDFENGNLFYTVTNGKHEYRFFSKDTLKTVGYYNMLGSDIETEESENSLTVHAYPTDENNSPIGPVKVHYNFEVCGDNALRVSTYFTSKIHLPIHMMSWMDLKFERSKFNTCQGFNPDFSVGVKKVVGHFKEVGMKDVQEKIYANDRHEILNETDRDVVYSDILNWLKDHI